MSNDGFKLTRREFLKLTAAASAAVSVGVAVPRIPSVAELEKAELAVGDGMIREVTTACLICMQRCPIAVGVDSEGKIRYVRYLTMEGYDEFFACCGRPQLIFELPFLRERIKKPLLRVGKRGEGKFKEISWDEALRLLTEWIKEYWDEPWRIVAMSRSGADSGFFHTFFKSVVGTPNVTKHCDTCHTGLDWAGYFLFGKLVSPSSLIPDYANADLIVIMGRNPTQGIVATAWSKLFAESRARKARLIVFDVKRDRLCELADRCYIIPPGTDLAIVLAIMNVILEEKLYNSEYLIKWTNASMLVYEDTLEPVKMDVNPLQKDKLTYLVYDEATGEYKLKPEAKKPALEYEGEYNGRRVKTVLLVLKDAVKKYTPEWASRITGVPAEEIRWVARELARAAPRAFIDHVYKAARYYNEGMFNRVRMIVNVLLGSMGVKGGIAYPGGKPKFPSPFEVIPIETRKPGGESIPEYWKKRGVKNIHKKCFSQLVEKTVVEGKPYPIGLLIIYNENIVSHILGAREFIEALKDENKVKHIVVIDTTFNETVLFADLVLPTTFFIEQDGATLHYAKKGGLGQIVAIKKVVDPPKDVDAKPCWQILWEVAKRLGLTKAEYDPRKVWEKQVEKYGGLKELLEKGVIPVAKGLKYHPWGGKPLPTETGEIELINVKLLREYREYLGKESPLNPLPTWIPPAWMRETGGQLADDQFVVVDAMSALTATNTFMRFSGIVRDAMEKRREYGVLIHTERAAKLGIRDGDLVRIKGPGGEMIAKAIVTDGVHPTVIVGPHATNFGELLPKEVEVVKADGSVERVRIFAKGGGYGVNTNLLGLPVFGKTLVVEEGARTAQCDFIVKVSKA
ncbi:molybdopterin oxidoreductase [Pyrolobus fumarii 1A]|uniref:Molybdopterin oxidoreductase n=1 Tax=Pyrolobus fumarii (strain DSM 11204 / 1A) TaxID=694429 RepID=G0EF53_PYRF1|nr:molybdopterin-dependent oxidoreductase [Pyrolobus fumarii]AEM38950.1 molybdopterin oxidoreductase [Pyrolobus fumarii 1A]